MSLRRELARKLLHVSTAVVPVAYAAGLPRTIVGATLAALALIALAVELSRRHATGAAAFTRATGTLLREHEHAGAWAGATWLLLAFLLAVLAYPLDVAVAAMLGVSLGDAAGAVVGRWWGERRRSPHVSSRVGDTLAGDTPAGDMLADAKPVGIAPTAKTWAGTIACAVATALGALLVARLSPGASLLAGALAAAAERPRWRIDDNLRIVIAVGTGILLCRLAFS
jgi:dolichol kinase